MSAGALTVAGNKAARAGTITIGANARVNGQKGLVVKAEALNNSGRFGSGKGDINADFSGNVVNSNLIHSAGTAAVTVGGTLTNASLAEVSANDQLALSVTGGLANSGKVLAANALKITTAHGVANSHAATMQGGTVTLQSASLDNGGTLTAQTGTLEATVSGNVNNSGELSSKKNLALAASGSLSNSGKLVSLGTLALLGIGSGHMGDITNTADGLVNGVSGLGISGQSLKNAGGLGLFARCPQRRSRQWARQYGSAFFCNLVRFTDSTAIFSNRNADVMAGQDLTVRGIVRSIGRCTGQPIRTDRGGVRQALPERWHHHERAEQQSAYNHLPADHSKHHHADRRS